MSHACHARVRYRWDKKDVIEGKEGDIYYAHDYLKLDLSSQTGLAKI